MRSLWIVLLTATLAACSSTPENEQAPAGVEDRKPGAAGAQSKGVDRPPVASVDLTAGRKSPSSMLTDPANILSKRSIYYDFDRFDVRDEYRPLVEAHAKYLRENPKAKILIQGNADERGSREYNLGLGQKRADGVKRMMLLLGVKEDQIESVSLGEEKPKSEGHDEAAWSQNRRSDILHSGEF
jgi:peptidoglycan-associated lipoprotein